MLSKLDCFFFYFLLYIVQYVDNQLVICNYLPMQNVYLPTQTIFLPYKMLYINMQIFEEYFRGTNGGQNFA